MLLRKPDPARGLIIMWPLLLRNTVNSIFLLGMMSLAAFGVSRLVPGDVVLDFLSIDERAYTTSMNPARQREAYARVARKRGLDLPAFYWSVSPGYFPAGLDSIVYVDDRRTVTAWIRHSLQGDRCINLYRSLRSALDVACGTSTAADSKINPCSGIHELLQIRELPELHKQSGMLLAGLPGDTSVWRASLDNAHREVEVLVRSPRRVSAARWLPNVTWNGPANQYHQWLAGLLLFKPLTSLTDGRDAWTKIGEAVRWTLLMNGLALLLALGAGMAIGIWSGAYDGRWPERLTHIILFVLFALPSFWIATLMITWFASGEWFSVFPSGGLGSYQRAGNIIEKWGVILWHLALPVICMALGALAYVSRQMKMSVVHQLGQPYAGYLRTQGIPKGVILRRHVVRNALFPMITLTGHSIPALLSGSLLMEVIFSIPGMGRLLYNSLVARDWPVVFPILMISAAVTVLAYLLADMAYKWADPRVKPGTL